MKIVIAPDKFKGSLSAIEASRAMARGVFTVLPEAVVELAPMADGGEGTVDALVAATLGTEHTLWVEGPLGDRVEARYGLLGDGQTAVIEMATASGLVLVPTERRDPLRATTKGTGELLKAAISSGVKKVILGIGGSATNDGGAGLGQALGYRLLDHEEHEIGPGGGALDRVARIDASSRFPGLEAVEIAIACDVTNPLCGPSGASVVYGPQKGATPDQISRLDRNLRHFAEIIERDLGISIADLPGAGAAGGLGGGLVAFAHGKLQRGVELIIEATHLRHRLQDADLCLTAEGALDASSAFGKTAVGVSRLASGMGIPTIALAGSIGPGAEAVLHEGIAAYFSICPGPIHLEDAISQAESLLEKTTSQVLRAFLARR